MDTGACLRRHRGALRIWYTFEAQIAPLVDEGAFALAFQVCAGICAAACLVISGLSLIWYVGTKLACDMDAESGTPKGIVFDVPVYRFANDLQGD